MYKWKDKSAPSRPVTNTCRPN